MKLGFIGLGKMGQQMVTRLVRAGHEVVATDLDAAAVALAVKNGGQGVSNREDLVRALGARPVIWLMIPAGFIDGELAALYGLLPADSIIIDGGNSDFRCTIDRAKQAVAQGIQLVDVGTSGGVHGLEEGFCMMVGGRSETVATIQPVIEALAQPGGWAHFGPSGAGHFIKMVHNAVEYGLMQAYAEGYRLLKDNPYFKDLDLGAGAKVWQHGSIVRSYLNEITADIFTANPSLDGIDGFVAESGEARWTLEVARELGIELPVTQAAFDVRLKSQQGQTNFGTKLLAAMRNIFGGHNINK